MKYTLAVFDMDGTILDTLEDLTESANHALRLSGFPERTLPEIRGFVGNGIKKLVERAAPQNASAAEIAKIYTDFTAHYKLHCADKTKPYDGISELLSSLRARGMKLAVVSNKADYAVRELAARYFDGLFDAVAGERDGVRKKPAPDSVNAVLGALNVENHAAVYIGDSEVDVETARNAGTDCISVLWGFRSEDRLRECGASVFASSPCEILKLI